MGQPLFKKSLVSPRKRVSAGAQLRARLLPAAVRAAHAVRAGRALRGGRLRQDLLLRRALPRRGVLREDGRRKQVRSEM